MFVCFFVAVTDVVAAIVIYNTLSLGNPKFEGHDYSISELYTAQEQIKRYIIFLGVITE